MHVRLIAVDKLRSPQIAQTCAELRKRLAPYYPYEELEVRASQHRDASGKVRDESERIARHLRADERVWVLERTGKQIGSERLARLLGEIETSGATRVTFVVGGTFGVDASLLERADFLWSLSELTFLHEWARAIVLEQLYRAAKILRNEPYHH